MSTITEPKPQGTQRLSGYQTDTTQRTAPRPDGKNLFFEIEVRSDRAIIDCRDEEHVGRHLRRKVTFRADKACKLHFSNYDVFGKTEQVLFPHQETSLFVVAQNVASNLEIMTECSVSIEGKEPATLHDSPPKIIVP